MTPDKLSKTWFENVWNKKRESFIHKHMHKNCIVHGLTESAPSGPNAFAEFQKVLLSTIKDMKVTVMDSLECGNKAMGICRVNGRYYRNDQII